MAQYALVKNKWSAAMVEGLTGNILASPGAASVFFKHMNQLMTFCSHWKYAIMCLSSGGSSESENNAVEKRQEHWQASCMGVFTVVTVMHLTVVMSQCVCVCVCVLKSRGLFSINCRLASISALVNNKRVIFNLTVHASGIGHQGCSEKKAYSFSLNLLNHTTWMTQKDRQTLGELQKKF